MSPYVSSEQPELRKSAVRDADLEGLAIVRPPETGRPPRRGHRSRKWAVVGLLLLALPAGALWMLGLVGRTATVDVTPVVRLPSGGASGLAATGYVVAQRQALIASKGTGRLEYLGVKVGDRVKEGQVIARLEHADIDALLQQMTAKLNVARAELGTAKPEAQDAAANFARVTLLLGQGFVTQSEHDIAAARAQRAAAAVKSAEAAIAAAQAERRAAEVQLENTNIRAPFDGVVVKKLAELGEVVSPMTASVRSGGSVVTIVDPLSVMVDAEVSEAMIHRVQAGQSAEIQLDSVPGHRYRGEVVQVMPIADRAKATVLTRLRFLDLDERVRAELSAKVVFGARPDEMEAERDQWAVPTTALSTRDGRSVVWLVKQGAAVETPVTVGKEVGLLTAVSGPLSQADEVILSPSDRLRGGERLTVRRPTADGR